MVFLPFKSAGIHCEMCYTILRISYMIHILFALTEHNPENNKYDNGADTAAAQLFGADTRKKPSE